MILTVHAKFDSEQTDWIKIVTQWRQTWLKVFTDEADTTTESRSIVQLQQSNTWRSSFTQLSIHCRANFNQLVHVESHLRVEIQILNFFRSNPCKYCAFCGCYGKNNKSVIPCVSQILGKKIPLNQNLTNYGIHVTLSWYGISWYVGHTLKFLKRWSVHRDTWNKPDSMDGSSQTAISRCYSMFHGIITTVNHRSMKLTMLIFQDNPVLFSGCLWR